VFSGGCRISPVFSDSGNESKDVYEGGRNGKRNIDMLSGEAYLVNDAVKCQRGGQLGQSKGPHGGA
jgi:hypothetical protein